MKRTIKQIRQIFALMPLAACLCLCCPPAPANAEGLFRSHGGGFVQKQDAPRHSFWNRLFHRSRPQTAAPAAAQMPPPQAKRRAAAPKIAKITAKSPDARSIALIGDAAALADVLTRHYADNPNIIIRSGAEAKPDITIIMPNLNDCPALGSPVPDSGAADIAAKACRERIDTAIQALRKSGAPWLCVGLPPFRDEAASRAAAGLNGIYKQAVSQAGGGFIAIWDGFTDDKGAFAFSGYDAGGRLARLRTNDGIGFTPAGRRKLAFYAAQAIDALGRDNAGDAAADAGGSSGNSSAPVNPLDIGAALDAGGRPVLAGGTFAPHLFLPSGELPPAPAGRADDFTRLPAAAEGGR